MDISVSPLAGFAIASLYSCTLALFLAGADVAGFGFGSAFSSQVQALSALAVNHERAELFAALYAAIHLAFSLPAMLSGRLIARLGLRITIEGYLALVMLVAAAGVARLWSRSPQHPRACHAEPAASRASMCCCSRLQQPRTIRVIRFIVTGHTFRETGDCDRAHSPGDVRLVLVQTRMVLPHR